MKIKNTIFQKNGIKPGKMWTFWDWVRQFECCFLLADLFRNWPIFHCILAASCVWLGMLDNGPVRRGRHNGCRGNGAMWLNHSCWERRLGEDMVFVFSFEGMILYVRLSCGQGGAPTYLIPTPLLHIHLSYPCVPALHSSLILFSCLMWKSA